MEEIEELRKRMLKKLQDKDLSGMSLGTKRKPYVLEGNFNILDLSGTKGYVEINTNFTNLVDASNAEGLVLTLKGKFHRVDGSGGKIKIISTEAYVDILDLSKSQEASLDDIAE
jgi:hypothetical protein